MLQHCSRISSIHRYNISMRNSPFKTQVDGFEMGRGIRPDYEINKTIEDVLLYKDVDKEKTLNLIKL